MTGKSFDFENFFTRPVILTLERVLMMDYLLADGFLPCDLEKLSPEQEAALFTKVRRLTKRDLGRIETPSALSAFITVGFSRN